MPTQFGRAEAGWVILSSAEARLKAKIEDAGTPLKDWDVQINYGIKTGFNEAFIIDGKTKDELILKCPKSAEIIHPILKGRDIGTYRNTFSDRWIIFSRRGIDIESYPSVYEYLLPFKKKLMPRPEQFDGIWPGRKSGNYKWYELQDSVDYWKCFKENKIIWLEISDVPKFSYDDKEFFVEATAFFLVGEHLHYLLSILNSKITQWYLDKITASTGAGTNRWKKVYLERIPIPFVDIEKRQIIMDHVKKILEEREDSHFTKAQKEINYLIYDLLKLSKAEIEIVEMASSATHSD